MRHRLRAAAPGAMMLLGGCMNLSGLDGSSSYACKAPEGVTCQSVSGTYANAVANNLPSQRARPAAAPAHAGDSSTATPVRTAVPAAEAPGASSLPLRSSPRILRLWFKPWEDVDRDLYDQGYVFVQIDGGRWQVEHAQRVIREAYAPLRRPAGDAAGRPAAREPVKGVQRPPAADDTLPGLPSPAARAEAND